MNEKLHLKLSMILFEWLVMIFGLTNTLSMFIRLMNHVLHAFINKLGIYNKNMNEHLDHLRNVFSVLHNEKLYVKNKKCTFYMEKIVFLGYVVTA